MIVTGKRLKTIRDVAENQLCSGCGACAYLAPEKVRMVDVLEQGRRPWFEAELDAAEDREALAVCPGTGLEHGEELALPGLIEELKAGWGPVLELWEGHAADPEIRFAGSSGGALTAISLYALNEGGMHGVLNTRTRPDVPYLTHTTLSRTREDLLSATGSLYTPASPCDGLGQIEEAPGPCMFVGKPCDVAATARAAEARPALGGKTALRVAMFCAGTPSTQATLEMIERMGVGRPDQVRNVRYRGNGWPGNATVRAETESGKTEAEETYAFSWDKLQRLRQWRCYVCADHTGQFADIAVGDPWYREIQPGESGESLIVIRTERGRAAFREMMAAGYMEARQVTPDILPRSLANLLTTGVMLWPRLWVLRLMGAAAPRYRGMPMFRYWLSQLGLRAKAQSIYGTVVRVFRKRLRERVRYAPWVPESREAGDS